jgi:hypothetical protein
VRDASSKSLNYDHNPLLRSFFQANINRFGSHSYDRTRYLYDFLKRLGRRFQLPLWRRPFWRDLLAAVAVPTHFRSRARTADVFSKRWISSCILLATTRSIAPWQLHAQSPQEGRLTVKPFFSGCGGPRSYRDLGFHFDPEENGGRLTWLPNVRGPKVIADTNGEYHNDPTRFIECSRAQETESTSSENLVAPGTFEFELSSSPSVLIFSMEGDAKTQHTQHVGAFLAGLMQNDIPSRTDLAGSPGSDVETGAELVAAAS